MGNRQPCDNHTVISLLCIAGKVFARILLNCLIEHLEQSLLTESQCGYREGRGTVEWCSLPDSCRSAKNKTWTGTQSSSTSQRLSTLFSREGLWRIMSKFGCKERLIQMSVNSMTECRPKSLMSEGLLVSSESQMVWNKDASLLQQCSARCLRRCWQMPSKSPFWYQVRNRWKAFQLASSPGQDWVSWWQASRSPMTVPSTLVVLKTWSAQWTFSPRPAQTSDLRSAPKDQGNISASSSLPRIYSNSGWAETWPSLAVCA